MFQDVRSKQRNALAARLSPLFARLKRYAVSLRGNRGSWIEPCERFGLDTGLYVLDDIACVRIRRR